MARLSPVPAAMSRCSDDKQTTRTARKIFACWWGSPALFAAGSGNENGTVGREINVVCCRERGRASATCVWHEVVGVRCARYQYHGGGVPTVMVRLRSGPGNAQAARL